MTATTEVERGFTITRQLNAPRELVFKAWTDPQHLQWFLGMEPLNGEAITVDLRVGGAWRVPMVENAERSYMTGGVYREIVEPEKLVFTWGATDGWPAIDLDAPDECPIVTVLLNEVDGGTEMVFRVDFADQVTNEAVAEWLALGIRGGWTQTVDRLNDEYLTGLTGLTG